MLSMDLFKVWLHPPSETVSVPHLTGRRCIDQCTINSQTSYAANHFLSKKRNAYCHTIPQCGIAVDNQSKRHHTQHPEQHCTTCVETALHHGHRAQQCCSASLLPSASQSAISITFNSLSKVLFIFPSWYLCTIGLEHIRSIR